MIQDQLAKRRERAARFGTSADDPSDKYKLGELDETVCAADSAVTLMFVAHFCDMSDSVDVEMIVSVELHAESLPMAGLVAGHCCRRQRKRSGRSALGQSTSLQMKRGSSTLVS